MEGRIAAFEEGRDCLLVVIGGAESALDDGLALKGRGQGNGGRRPEQRLDLPVGGGGSRGQGVGQSQPFGGGGAIRYDAVDQAPAFGVRPGEVFSRSMIPAVREGPSWRARARTTPESEARPMPVNAVAKRAPSAATRTSAQSAMPSPAPTQAPSTATTSGICSACSSLTSGL